MTMSVTRFPWGLINPLSRMNRGVRIGELSRHVLLRLRPPQRIPNPLPQSQLHYVTFCGQTHHLLLRESLRSLGCAWTQLPELTVISDGSWNESEIRSYLHWWPTPIRVWSREMVLQSPLLSHLPYLRRYASLSPFGLKLASLFLLAHHGPYLYVDVDILWFDDPLPWLGSLASWPALRAVPESCLHQHEELARRFCPQALNPPYLNGGFLAVAAPFLPSDQIEAMATLALHDPMDGRAEQTIFATAAHHSGGTLDPSLCCMDYSDAAHTLPRPMRRAGFRSRHYVNWMRHHFYTDALRLRLGLMP